MVVKEFKDWGITRTAKWRCVPEKELTGLMSHLITHNRTLVWRAWRMGCTRAQLTQGIGILTQREANDQSND